MPIDVSESESRVGRRPRDRRTSLNGVGNDLIHDVFDCHPPAAHADQEKFNRRLVPRLFFEMGQQSNPGELQLFSKRRELLQRRL
jgi:hypothetical protein